MEEFKKETQKIKNYFEERLKSIRGHRLSLNFLENFEVEIYHQKMPLKSLGHISQIDSLAFRFDPYDLDYLNEIEKSIIQREHSFSLVKDHKSLLIKFPPLTEETRREIIKSLTSLKEEARIKARQLRDDFIKNLKSKKEKGEISEDEFFKTKKNLDEEIEKFNNDIAKIFDQKEKELLK